MSLSLSLSLVTAPAEPPITVNEASFHLKVEDSASDAYIAGLIAAALVVAEKTTRRRFVTQTWNLNLDAFPAIIQVPYAPLISVGSINYINTDGDSTLLADSGYTVDSNSEPGRICPSFGNSWPATQRVFNAVTVQFTCGFGGPEVVPSSIKQAMFLSIGHWFEHREVAYIGANLNTLPMAVDTLLSGHRVWGF